MSTLPSITTYTKYLNIASLRFNLSLDECRNLFGLYTEEQWTNLFSELRYIVKKQELTFYVDYVIEEGKLYLIEEMRDNRIKTTFLCKTDKDRVDDLVETEKLIIVAI